MCMPKAPKAPKPVTPPPVLNSNVIDDAAITERDRMKRKRMGMRGQQSTILTKGMRPGGGANPQTSAAKTAFGA